MSYIYNSMHAKVSPQVSKFGIVTNLGSANFSMGNNPFLIKNDNDENVTLEVKPKDGKSFVSTIFQPGWNPEIVTAIKQTSDGGTLLWGY